MTGSAGSPDGPVGPDLWTDAFLDRMREAADPVADAVVRDAVGEVSVASMGRLTGLLIRAKYRPDVELPPPVRRYLEETGRLPDWVDPVLVQRAQRFFVHNGPQVILAAFCSSLPTLYSGANAAQVFAVAKDQMRNNAFRRVPETIQLVVDVLAPGGLTPEGRGVRTSQIVRLIHSGVRSLKEDGGRWNPEHGRPINQEDLAWLLLSLSRGVLDGMRRLGFTVSDEEETAFLHAWNAVGTVLGIDERLMAWNGPDARWLLQTIERRQARPSAEGQVLNDALVETIEDLVPGTMFDGVARAIMRRLLGSGSAAAVGVEPADGRLGGAAHALRGRMRDARERVQASVPAIDRVQREFSRVLVEGLMRVASGSRTALHIPRGLADQWGVAPADS